MALKVGAFSYPADVFPSLSLNRAPSTLLIGGKSVIRANAALGSGDDVLVQPVTTPKTVTFALLFTPVHLYIPLIKHSPTCGHLASNASLFLNSCSLRGQSESRPCFPNYFLPRPFSSDARFNSIAKGFSSTPRPRQSVV